VNPFTPSYTVGLFRPFYLVFVLFFFLFSCSDTTEKEEPRFDYYPNKISNSYAKGFSVSYHNSYKVVDVYKDRDSSELFQRYYLVEQGTKLPKMEPDAEMIRVPLASVSCLSTTQIAYLSVLGKHNAISGVGYADFIKDSTIQEQLSKGWTMEITRGGQVDKELILQSNTSTMMANAFDELSLSSLNEFGIPVIYSTEYLENDALARAEWIKFFALFFNAEKRASTYFSEIENNYNEIHAKIEVSKAKPGVLFGSYYQGTWYVPGGRSLISTLFSDAGAYYIYEDQEDIDNIHIDPESLMERMSQLDYWGFVLSKEEDPVLSDFLAGDKRMQDLALDLDLNFFYCNSYRSDYFGMANLEPDVLLADLGKIFHPSLFPEHQFVYFQPFK
jgi:iron complex transport system substrate-binding protein